MGRFAESLNGIVLSFDNIKVIGDTSDIIDDIPYLCIDIEVDFLVLRFTKNEIIKGVIQKVDRNKIDLLVFNTFNAQINIPMQFKNNENFKRAYSTIGQQISFQIQRHKHFSGKNMVQIIGTLPKQSNIGIFDEQQNFWSIVDILRGKEREYNIVQNVEMDVDMNENENDLDIEREVIKEESPKMNEVEAEKKKAKKKKRKDKESKRKSKKDKKERRKKRKEMDDDGNDDTDKRRKRRKIQE